MSKVLITTKIPESALAKLKQANIDYVVCSEQENADEDYLLAQIKEAQAVVSAVNIQITKEIIEAGSNLKVIANIGDGYSNIDVKTAGERHIPVTNTPTHDSIYSTAEITLTLLLALSRRVINGHKMCEAQNFKGWQVTGYLGGHQAAGKTLAIIGFGRIGKVVAQMARGFDMNIVYVDPVKADEQTEKALNVSQTTLAEALKTADYITLNCAYSRENHHMIDEEQLAAMSPKAYLINCARGPLINEGALVNALKQKKIAGAALDVHEFEPHITDGLRELDNVVLTPHIGNDTIEARNEMADTAIEQVINALSGKALSFVVNQR